MDNEAQQKLAQLIRTQRVAALGTLARRRAVHLDDSIRAVG